MPLVRIEVRNEYRLGMPELYKEVNREDPKQLLDGVAVAGLVGILRQLGDLSEFAAEVFHGLQEQVVTISSRSRKLIVRVQNIEVTLPPLENAMLAQRSHLHFAYTTGSNWHAHLQNEQNHFIYSDLPCFIMDKYGECHGPPRLHLLDKFDSGGTGSCLKRYSDPTFFRRASAGFFEAHVENVRRDKRAHRRKKKLWLKNGEVPYGASHNIPISSHNARKLDPGFRGQNSPPRTSSTSDDVLKSRHGEQSYSFDSRDGSGYIECIFSPGYTIKSDERKSEKDSSQNMLCYSDNLNVDFLNGQREVGENDIQEQTGTRSSCVSWDEKTEIREPVGSQNHCVKTAKLTAPDIDRDPTEVEAVNFRSFDIKRMAASVSGEVQLDDIDSRVDNYMDVHNTVESESDSELECQTKRDVEQHSTSNSRALDNGIDRLIPQQPYSHLPNFELHVPQSMREMDQFSALKNEVLDEGEHSITPQFHEYSMSNSSNIEPHVIVHIPSDRGISESHSRLSPESPKVAKSFSNKKASTDNPILLPSEIDVHVESPQEGIRSSTLNTFAGINSGESDVILDPLDMRTFVEKSSSSDSTEPILPKSDIIITSSDLHKPQPLSSSITGINFWTNGGLLGLEPSKPSDFSVLNSVTCDSVDKSKEEQVLHLSLSNVAHGDRTADETNLAKNTGITELERNSGCSKSDHDYNKEDSLSIMTVSSRSSKNHLDVRPEHSIDVRHSLSEKQAHKQYSLEKNTKISGIQELVNPVGQATISSMLDSKVQMLESSTELIGNGFHRKISCIGDDSFLSTMKNGVSEPKGISREHQAFTGRSFKEQNESGYLFMSPSSSPPLEHMNISFQPIEGLESSRLKLKFPDRSEGQESSGDKFPFFQLVPQQFISLQECGVDSDDDTFCRSSPHMSDDCFSHYSQSDSEILEAEESTKCSNPVIYDDLCRTPTTEYVSRNPQTGREDNGVLVDNHKLQNPFTETCSELIQAGHNLDLPSYDALNPLFGKEPYNTSDSKYLELDLSTKPTPPSPPLPPVQWRDMKQNPDVAIENPDTSFESLKLEIGKKLLSYSISQQPKPAPIRHDHDTEAIIRTTKDKQLDCQKGNEQKDANQPTDRKETDENEELLQQIRTKSFSLRRTTVDRPTLPGASANVKVTAILEKANAIRHVIGSDDGEEQDSWSDT